MKSKFAILLAFGLAAATANPTSLDPRTNTPTVQGFDISHYQENVDFSGAYAAGARFVIIKVTPSRPPQPNIYNHTTTTTTNTQINK